MPFRWNASITRWSALSSSTKRTPGPRRSRTPSVKGFRDWTSGGGLRTVEASVDFANSTLGGAAPAAAGRAPTNARLRPSASRYFLISSSLASSVARSGHCLEPKTPCLLILPISASVRPPLPKVVPAVDADHLADHEGRLRRAEERDGCRHLGRSPLASQQRLGVGARQLGRG